MKKNLFVIAILTFSLSLKAQSVKEVGMQLSAVPSGNTAIEVKWEAVSNASSYDLYRKELGQTNWANVKIGISGSANSYLDNQVESGKIYEYFIRKNHNTASYRGYGYTSTGMEVSARTLSGDLLLIVDSTAYSELEVIIQDTLIPDLIGDGWHVSIEQVGRSQSGTVVKGLVENWYSTGVSNPTVYLLGHVPVVYSGGFQLDTVNGVAGLNNPPDAHVPQHCGAWATDCYYGDMGGVWTDVNTYDFNVNNSWGKNFPGDGKYDQHRIPDKTMEVAIGRVDLYDLPAVNADEFYLLKNYIRKSHNFRHRKFEVQYKALISDRLNWLGGEAPGRTGWMNYPGLVGKDNIVENTDYFNHLKTNDYLFSQVTSTASYTSISGIGSVSAFKDSVHAVFNSYFGSYFGDWDIKNNFLRGCLASESHTLTSVWNGRPSWYFHNLGMGNTIGEATKLTQSNTGTYFIYSNFINGIHINLMGDPSLRIHPIKPASSVVASSDVEREVNLTWTKSDDSEVIGYYVYRSSSANKNGKYELLTENPVSGLSYKDDNPYYGDNYYMVRSVKLESRGSGTYYNLGQGVFGSVRNVESGNFYLNEMDIVANQWNVYPNPANKMLYGNTESLELTHLILYNSIGAVVYENENVQGNFEIDLSLVNSGVYFLQLNGTRQKLTKKIIVQ